MLTLNCLWSWPSWPCSAGRTMRFWQRCTASSLAIPTSGLVPARSCLACRLAVDREVCSAVVCRFAGQRVHHSPQAAAPAATPSAQRIDSACCMSRCRPIRASCFAAGAGHPAPGLPAEPRQTPHPGKSLAEKTIHTLLLRRAKLGANFARSRRENAKRFFVYIFHVHGKNPSIWMLCRK